MNFMNDYVPLVNLTRGDIVESVHLGALVISDNKGNILFSKGNQDLVTYPRSSMKPLQVLPLLENDGDKFFNFSAKEIAIMCASHSGTDDNVNTIKSIHNKVGLSLENLQCGVHWPSDKATAIAMRERGEQPTSYHHNCSGKHSGMLAQATKNGFPLENYLSMENPVQQLILKTVAEMCEVDPQTMAIGVDGCSAPVFAMSLRSFAIALAKICQPDGLSVIRASACRRITSAMNSHPNMVAGPGKLDTIVMEALPGKIILKGGAEGYQSIGIMPGALGEGSPGLGIAIKIADGDQTRRALNCLTIELLHSLCLLNKEQKIALKEFGSQPLKNWRGFDIGVIEPAFKMPNLNY